MGSERIERAVDWIHPCDVHCGPAVGDSPIPRLNGRSERFAFASIAIRAIIAREGRDTNKAACRETIAVA
jgi:hypothetical protein